MAARCERRRNRAVVGMLGVLIINKGRDSRGRIMINKVENSLSLSFLIIRRNVLKNRQNMEETNE